MASISEVLPAADDDWMMIAKRLVQLAADGRQVADQLVGRLAHHVEVGHDPVQQVRVAQQPQGCVPFLGRHARGRLLRLHHLR